MILFFTDFLLILSKEVVFILFILITEVGGMSLCPFSRISLNFKNGCIGRSFVRMSAT